MTSNTRHVDIELSAEERETAVDVIWDAMDDHGHNGIECRPEKPMDYTAGHILDALTPVVERTVAARVEGVVAAVEAIHRPYVEPGWDPYCYGCYEAGGYDAAPSWPCATAEALRAAQPAAEGPK